MEKHTRFFLTLVIFLFALTSTNQAQAEDLARKRTAPFQAVKWVKGQPWVWMKGGWGKLLTIQNNTASRITRFCKKVYGKRWKKRFSEDLVEVMQKMKAPLPKWVYVRVKRGGKIRSYRVKMTKHSRRLCWVYNNRRGDWERRKKNFRKRYRGRSGKVKGGRTYRRPTKKRWRTKWKRPRRPLRPRGTSVYGGRQFSFRRARIVFVWTGQFRGKQILYVDDYGKTMVLIDKRVLGGIPVNETIIWKDKKSTIYKHKTRTVRSYRIAIRPAAVSLSVLAASDSMMARVGFMRKGNRRVAGKKCAFYERRTGKMLWRSWRWKGIELKIEMKGVINVSYTKVATSVQVGTKIPKRLFTAPRGYRKK